MGMHHVHVQCELLTVGGANHRTPQSPRLSPQAASSIGNAIPDFGYPKGLLETLSLAGTSPSPISPATKKLCGGGASAGAGRAGVVTPVTPLGVFGGSRPLDHTGGGASRSYGQEFYAPVSKSCVCVNLRQAPGIYIGHKTTVYALVTRPPRPEKRWGVVKIYSKRRISRLRNGVVTVSCVQYFEVCSYLLHFRRRQ